MEPTIEIWRSVLSWVPLPDLRLNWLYIVASMLWLLTTHPSAWGSDLDDLYSAATGGSESVQPREAPTVGSPAPPEWSLRQFLYAEAMNAQGDVGRAMVGYQQLVDWAAKDPHGDGLGGSPLAMVALWRWSVLAEGASADVATLKSMINATYNLRTRRLARELFERAFTSRLPQIQEDIVLRLARLAYNIGQQVLAQRLFIDYLTVSTKEDLDSFGETMMKEIAEQEPSFPRVELLRGRRMFDLGRIDKAHEVLQRLMKADDLQVRAEANYYMAKILWAKREWAKTKTRKPLLDLLATVVEDAPDPNLSEKALYQRAILSNRIGVGRERAIFKQDMLRLIDEYPDGSRVDDALYHLARDAEDAGQTEEALKYYGRLQDLKPGHDWESSAFFKPAIALYGTGEKGRALEMLQRLEERYPEGDLHLSALFWIGRIAHELGKKELAKSSFDRAANEAPFSFYGLRGRMWLSSGPATATTLAPDAGTHEWIASRFKRSAANPAIADDSPYARLLRSAIESGVYASALAAYDRVRDRFPGRRMADLALHNLSREELLSVVLLASLRATAGVAFDLAKTAESRLDLAAAIGSTARDVTMQMVLVGERFNLPSRMVEAQQSERYLASAYPRIHIDLIQNAANEFKVDPALLYAVIRRESLFNPRAISAAGAIGLFQFMPQTFRTLDERYRLLETVESGMVNTQTYLMSPERAVFLGARWFGEALVTAKNKNGYLLRVAEHNAGWPAVREWTNRWKKDERMGDLEYMIETMGFGETRRFSRSVLTDYAIVRTGGMFGE